MSQRGSLKQRGRTWTAYWFVTDENGRRKQKTKGGFATKREAAAFLTSVLHEVQQGTYKDPVKVTVAQFLRDEWLPTLTQRASTRASYTTTVEKWIVPFIGGVMLPSLTPARVQKWLGELREAGGAKGRKLSDRSIQYGFTVLRMGLEVGVRRGFIPRNPAAVVERPRSSSREMQAWSAEEARTFLEQTRNDRLYAAWFLFLARGPRRGELAGLRWSDVDLDAMRMRIRHTRVVVDGKATTSEPKTKQGTRAVPLDEQLVAALRAHRAQQLEERLAWGKGWTETAYIFKREDGLPYHPEFFSDRFERLVLRSGLPLIRLHDTRHTAATLALRAGIPTEVVSRWLGHASVSITQDIYQHEVPSLMEEAGQRITSLLISRP